jgi:hypothetical protein
MESNKEDMIGGKLNVPDDKKKSATYTVPGNKEGKEALTAQDIYREHWREWIRKSYGDEVADNAKFDLHEHSWIESAMEEFASLKVAESRKANYTREQVKRAIDMARKSDYTEDTEMSVAHKYYEHSDIEIFNELGEIVPPEKEWIEVHIDTHKIENGAWVKCVAEIRNNETLEIREYEIDQVLYNGDTFPDVFNWKENNYSCDCNRRLFFDRAIGAENDESDIECSDGKFSVNLKNKKDGFVYYREF